MSSSGSAGSAGQATIEQWQPPLGQGLYAIAILPAGIDPNTPFDKLSPEDQARYRAAIQFGGYRSSHFEERAK